MPAGAELSQLVLPDDPLPHADAIVSVGHVLSYLATEAAIEGALRAVARALRPGGVLVVDLCTRTSSSTRPPSQGLLAGHGLAAHVRSTIGDYALPDGLVAVIDERPG